MKKSSLSCDKNGVVAGLFENIVIHSHSNQYQHIKLFLNMFLFDGEKKTEFIQIVAGFRTKSSKFLSLSTMWVSVCLLLLLLVFHCFRTCWIRIGLFEMPMLFSSSIKNDITSIFFFLSILPVKCVILSKVKELMERCIVCGMRTAR